MQVRKLSCPSCGVNLRVAATIPVGKRIKCPKCGEGFAVPDDEDDEVPTPAPAARIRKAAPPPDEDEEEDREEEMEERPEPRKRRKKKKKQQASNLPLILGLSVFGVLILSAGVLLAVFRPWEGKTNQVAATNAAKPESPASRPGQGRRDRQPGREEPADATQAGGGETQLASAGKAVYDSTDCRKCHVIGGGGKGKGPNLSRVGANPTHTVAWLSAFVADPRSQRPRSRGMPAYGEKLSPEDLRSLAEYLSSLK